MTVPEFLAALSEIRRELSELNRRITKLEEDR